MTLKASFMIVIKQASGKKGFHGTNTLANFTFLSVTKKALIRLTPGANVIKLFTAVSY